MSTDMLHRSFCKFLPAVEMVLDDLLGNRSPGPVRRCAATPESETRESALVSPIGQQGNVVEKRQMWHEIVVAMVGQGERKRVRVTPLALLFDDETEARRKSRTVLDGNGFNMRPHFVRQRDKAEPVQRRGVVEGESSFTG